MAPRDFNPSAKTIQGTSEDEDFLDLNFLAQDKDFELDLSLSLAQLDIKIPDVKIVNNPSIDPTLN